MIKRGFAVFFIALFLFSLVANSMLVSAVTSEEIQDQIDEKQAELERLQKNPSKIRNFFGKLPLIDTTDEKIARLEEDISNLETQKKLLELGEGFDYYTPPFLKNFNFTYFYIRVVMFVLIFALLLSCFALVNFPPGLLLQGIISLVLTFFITYMVRSKEYAISLMSFNGIVVALYFSIPIILLSFISFVAASRFKGFGGYLFQRLLWIFYSLYLLLKTFLLGKGILGPKFLEWLSFLPNWVLAWFVGPKVSFGMFVLHLFVFIFVFYIFVWKNNKIIEMLEEQKYFEALRKYTEKTQRAEAQKDVWASS
jgi:hypothetical protein